MPDAAKQALDTPYVGLQPYAEEHRDYFFGRERERRIITANLYAARLSVLYGASGVGKSSILQAGVVADLRKSPRTAVVYFNHWHDDSFLERLKTQCLLAVNTATSQTNDVDASLPLDAFLEALQQKFGGSILVLLDQFEEYFLYHPEEETTHSFDAELARTVNRDDVQAGFLIALRDDWLSRLDRFRARIPNLLGNAIRLDHLDAAAAEDAIRKPLAVWNQRHPGANVGIDDGLVTRIIHDVQTGRLSLSESAGLGEAKTHGEHDRIETAFLQLVLLKLWEAERQSAAHVLRLTTYERLGGASQIVQAHLNGLLDEVSENDRESCARMFPYMVTPGGAKVAHETSDLVAFSERPRAETVALLDRLTSQRVLRRITPPERYEIFHDVLAPAILDWRARYLQDRLAAQRQADERLRAEARSAGTLRRRAWLAGVFALVAVGVAAFGLYQRSEADAERKKAITAYRAAVAASDSAQVERKRAEIARGVADSLRALAVRRGMMRKKSRRLRRLSRSKSRRASALR